MSKRASKQVFTNLSPASQSLLLTNKCPSAQDKHDNRWRPSLPCHFDLFCSPPSEANWPPSGAVALTDSWPFARQTTLAPLARLRAERVPVSRCASFTCPRLQPHMRLSSPCALIKRWSPSNKRAWRFASSLHLTRTNSRVARPRAIGAIKCQIRLTPLGAILASAFSSSGQSDGT